MTRHGLVPTLRDGAAEHGGRPAAIGNDADLHEAIKAARLRLRNPARAAGSA